MVDGAIAYDKQEEIFFAHIRPRANVDEVLDPGEEGAEDLEAEDDSATAESGEESEADDEGSSDEAEEEADDDAEDDASDDEASTDDD